MATHIRCNHCHALLRLKAVPEGKRPVCPKCRSTIDFSGGQAEPVVLPTAPPSPPQRNDLGEPQEPRIRRAMTRAYEFAGRASRAAGNALVVGYQAARAAAKHPQTIHAGRLFMAGLSRTFHAGKTLAAYYRTRREALWERLRGVGDPDRDIHIEANGYSETGYRDGARWKVRLPDCCAVCGKQAEGAALVETHPVEDVTWPLVAPAVGLLAGVGLAWWSFWFLPFTLLAGLAVGYALRGCAEVELTVRRCPADATFTGIPKLWLHGNTLVLRVGHRRVKKRFEKPAETAPPVAAVAAPTLDVDLGPIPLVEAAPAFSPPAIVRQPLPLPEYAAPEPTAPREETFEMELGPGEKVADRPPIREEEWELELEPLEPRDTLELEVGPVTYLLDDAPAALKPQETLELEVGPETYLLDDGPAGPRGREPNSRPALSAASREVLRGVARRLAASFFDSRAGGPAKERGAGICDLCNRDVPLGRCHLIAPFVEGEVTPGLACEECFLDQLPGLWDGDTSRMPPSQAEAFAPVAQASQQLVRQVQGELLAGILAATWVVPTPAVRKAAQVGKPPR